LFGSISSYKLIMLNVEKRKTKPVARGARPPKEPIDPVEQAKVAAKEVPVLPPRQRIHVRRRKEL